ncbi:NUDIX hydrolase [Streptomyces sp. V3I7]|uniref:NUDIX hydrolase n=1 Tax=Streptomyces sp. V3I7 TaxID=3042278 RepID=UPI002788A0F5|nr:NUDIX hydrolase [Streptomyces sp. V3I7]MDQ0993724.1 8-oxo-dGTP diphosphatase [Streptomyces sp. V3I7]
MDMEIPGELRLAAAVVMDGQGRVLVVRRSEHERFLPRAWGVPCGKLEPGESPEDGALRELKEETGLLGEVLCSVGHSRFVSEYRGRQVVNRQENFLVAPLSRHVVLPEPDQAYAWLGADELPRFDLDAYNRRIIEKAFRSLATSSGAAR